MRIRCPAAAAAALALCAAGCGGGGESTTNEGATEQRTATPVANCMRRAGMGEIETEDVSKAGIDAVLVGGRGPSGAAVGALILKDPRFTNPLAESFARHYRVRVSSDGKDLLIYGDDVTAEDRSIVESCLIESAE